MPSPQIKLRDIAEAVRVSRMTVSMALRNDPRVAQATRQRVKDAAGRLGYVPNPQMGKLMAELARSRRQTDRRLGELAFITSFNTEWKWRQSYHENSCFEGARRQAEEMGYRLTPFWSLSQKFAGGRLSELLWSRGIEGLVIAPLGDSIFLSHEASLRFQWERFCSVQIGATLTQPSLHLARHNHFAGMMLCLDSLERLGYRRIGLALSTNGDLRSHHRWTAAYLSWRVLRGRERELPCFIFSGEIGPRELASWIRQHRIEAVVSMDAQPLETLRALKFDVPGDLGFATLDHNNFDNSISGIDQHAEAIGTAAINQLVQSIRTGETGIPERPTQILVDGAWFQGKSTRQVRRAGPGGPPLMEQPLRNLA